MGQLLKRFLTGRLPCTSGSREYHAAASSGVTRSASNEECSAARHKDNRLAATECFFEKQRLAPLLQAITRLSEDSLWPGCQIIC